VTIFWCKLFDFIEVLQKMTKKCELTGVSVMSGNNVSHSQRKTRRKFLPNLKNVRLNSDALGLAHRFRIRARVLKTIEVHGGLDSYLLKTKDCLLSQNALDVKKRIKSIISAKA
jgi:large subunit ribosomal protein L28